jgi:MoaA/NifB/PqqE/SkfB family radical SAM enzyme
MLALFPAGTPEAPGAALAAARAALSAGEPIAWHVDPGNLPLLSRAVAEGARVTAILAAIDEADDRTLVAHEGELSPTLRRLHDRGLALRLSVGRPYVLPPPAIDISTNDLCGLECAMCNNRQTRRDPAAMAPAEIRALLAEAAAWGIRRAALTGAGEPFRDPEMLGYVREANRLGMLATITTNGFPVSEALAAELAEAHVSVSVSIHGAEPATQDALVGVPKAGENAFRAVRRLCAARDALGGRSKLAVNVSTVIQRGNVGEIARLARWALAAGCDGMNVQPINLQHGTIRGDRIVRRDDLLRLGSLWPTPEQAEALARELDALAAIAAEHPRFLHAAPERLALFRRYFADPSREALGVRCRVGEAFLAVDLRGAIKPCYRLPWSHGDARLKGLRAVWNSAAYARTRALVDACPLTCMNNCFFRGTGQSPAP